MFIGQGGKTELIALRIKVFFFPKLSFSNFFFVFKDSDKTALFSLYPHLRKISASTHELIWDEKLTAVFVQQIRIYVYETPVSSCDSWNTGAHLFVYKPASYRGHPHDHLMVGTVQVVGS